MTNVALAILTDPTFVENVREIVFMGGAAYTDGNVTASAEFNIFVDPHAARIVMESGIPLTMIGLDVTRHVTVPQDRIVQDWPSLSPRASIFARMVGRYASGDPALHDPCVIAWLLEPDAFESIPVHIAAECAPGENYGRTVVRRLAKHIGTAGPNALLVTTGDSTRIGAMIEAALRRL